MWQDLEDAAWDHMNAGNKVKAAIAARLAISKEPNAIDCYVILAQASDVLGQKLAYAREAIRLGEQTFAEEIKSAPTENFPFWSVLETRPYMRGLHTLSLALWEDPRPGASDEAIDVAQKALRICPNDNIGFRFLLPEWCAKQNRWTEGAKVLSQHVDEYRTETKMWAALYAYHNGDMESARTHVVEARKLNSHMTGQLLLKHAPKPPRSEYVAVGSIEEAKSHASQAYDLWKAEDGSTDWLRQFPRR